MCGHQAPDYDFTTKMQRPPTHFCVIMILIITQRRFMREYLPVALAFVSALLLYLGSPGQQWRTSALWPRYSRKMAALAAVCAVVAGAMDGTNAGHLWVTFCLVLTTQMACLVAFPFIGALWKPRRSTETRR
jgi:hypothetical protein